MKKMSYSNIKDVLSRDEMKEIMAGSAMGNCSVMCIQIAGSWTGYYGSTEALLAAVSTYCGEYGANWQCG